MSTIWMDPVELRASAGTLAENAMRIQETMTGTRTTCQCEVPRSLIAWLDEELLAITVAALQAAVGYLQQALDVAQRGQQIEADQSLVAATPALGGVDGAVTVTTMADLNNVLVNAGSVIGGTSFTDGITSSQAMFSGPMVIGGTSFTDGITPAHELFSTSMVIGGPGSRETFLANNPLLAAAENLRNTNPGAANQLLGLHGNLSTINNNMISNILAPEGLDFVGSGIYEDESGRQGTLSQTYRDRRDGDLKF